MNEIIHSRSLQRQRLRGPGGSALDFDFATDGTFSKNKSLCLH